MPKYKLKEGFGEHYTMKKGDLVLLKPGSEIECTAEEIAPFADKFELVKAAEPPKPTIKLKIVNAKDGKFNVVNTKTNKVVNSEPLTKEAAEALVEEQTK